MTTSLSWYRCPDCGLQIDVPEGVDGLPDCPRCSAPATEARHRIVQLEGMLEELGSVSQREMADAQRVILDQQTEIADLRTQLTHPLADAADLTEPPPAASPEESGL